MQALGAGGLAGYQRHLRLPQPQALGDEGGQRRVGGTLDRWSRHPQRQDRPPARLRADAVEAGSAGSRCQPHRQDEAVRLEGEGALRHDSLAGSASRSGGHAPVPTRIRPAERIVIGIISESSVRLTRCARRRRDRGDPQAHAAHGHVQGPWDEGSGASGSSQRTTTRTPPRLRRRHRHFTRVHTRTGRSIGSRANGLRPACPQCLSSSPRQAQLCAIYRSGIEQVEWAAGDALAPFGAG